MWDWGQTSRRTYHQRGQTSRRTYHQRSRDCSKFLPLGGVRKCMYMFIYNALIYTISLSWITILIKLHILYLCSWVCTWPHSDLIHTVNTLNTLFLLSFIHLRYVSFSSSLFHVKYLHINMYLATDPGIFRHIFYKLTTTQCDVLWSCSWSIFRLYRKRFSCYSNTGPPGPPHWGSPDLSLRTSELL